MSNSFQTLSEETRLPQCNIWNKWDPLKAVMLGDIWGPEFFENIKDPKVRKPLQRITEETREELSNFERVLKDFGCKVIRPLISKSDRLEKYINEAGEVKIPRNALQPRDNQIVIGNKLWTDNADNPGIVLGLRHNGYKIYDMFEFATSSDNYLKMENFSHEKHPPTSANVFLIGNDAYVNYTCCMPMSALQNMFGDIRINVLDNPYSHNDGCFHPIKPGAILSVFDFQNYSKTFENWDVCYLEREPWTKAKEFDAWKRKTDGKWWHPEAVSNPEFAHYVNAWLDEWVGYVEETVFDVNVLVLDEYHVCVSSLKNKTVLEFLKKHKMEPVYVPWRHRYFWDGGLHCITLDLYREGEKQDYFPNRQEPIILEEYLIK